MASESKVTFIAKTMEIMITNIMMVQMASNTTAATRRADTVMLELLADL